MCNARNTKRGLDVCIWYIETKVGVWYFTLKIKDRNVLYIRIAVSKARMINFTFSKETRSCVFIDLKRKWHGHPEAKYYCVL